MADPATIIGTTSAILDFAVFTGNVMSTAYGLYSSTSGSTEENDKIEDVTRKMTGLLGDLQVPVNTIFQSTGENYGTACCTLPRHREENLILVDQNEDNEDALCSRVYQSDNGNCLDKKCHRRLKT
jgi:hypothetical protein